ncbi:undecaprenyl-diphosphatase [Ulvibacter sp. MAR_2010_11]|uniref:phosphatase PAP2 family protein n=1 Tax=Ulvibacter sp. MAR_2010_11 TaxID=1250229 RepID=UPI000C2C5E2F|nr:phosphatase PAP2 family protein [Ulvibacter sp. MAR_2010_11]PKA82289.1 undecaprenyl-diphosphatase [Ulvibacter sp. MAR_2010_11]
MLEVLKEWDRELFIFLNSLGIEQYDGFWLFVTQIKSWIPLFAFLVFLIFYYCRGKQGFIVFGFLLLTFSVTLFVTDFTKELVGRLRPNNVEAFAELIRALQKPTTFSFFSGHASSSFSITTFVVLVLRKHTKWIYFVYLWPLIFIMSRIYVGVHYPSDLFVGALVGTTFAVVFYRFYSHLTAYLFRRTVTDMEKGSEN